MNSLINAEVMSLIFDEQAFKEELIMYLNEVIEDELSKENMDTDIIDESVEILEKLATNQEIISAVSSKDILRLCHQNTANHRIKWKRAFIIAAAVMLLSGMTVAATPALAQRTREMLGQIVDSLGAASDSTMAETSEVKSLYGRFEEEPILTVPSKEDIHPENIEIVAIDENGYEKVIPITECEVTYQDGFGEDGNQCLVIVSYKGCAFSIIYNIEE